MNSLSSIPMEHWYKVLNMLPNPISLSKKIGREKELNNEIIFLNQAFWDTIGYDVEKMNTNHDWFVLAYPNKSERDYAIEEWFRLLKKAENTGEKLLTFTTLITCKDGCRRCFNVTTSTAYNIDEVYRITTFIEIESPSQTILNLQERTTQLRAVERGEILDNSLNEIYIFDAKDYHFLYINKGAQRNIGYSSSEISKLRPIDIKPLLSQSEFDSVLYPIIHNRENHISFSTQHQRKDGTRYDVDIYLQKTTFESREAYVAIILDVTQRKKAERVIVNINKNLEKKVYEEIEKNRQQQLMMIQQSRLAQMGEMISMIAHQWRQPLNNLAILTQTITLKYNKGKLDDKTIDKFEKNTTQQIQGMSETINDFSNFFKPESEKISFNINDLILRSINMIKPMLYKHEISLELQADKPLYCYGFAQELGQVLINILNNAKDALIQKSIKNKSIEVKILEMDGNIQITIKDNAGGIPIEIIDKIFEPYFSTKSDKNGTGLGLYMSKMIVEDHMDGSLTCFNNENGAVFIITLNKGENL